MDLAALKGIDQVFLRVLAVLLRFFGDLDGIDIELGCCWQPAHLRALKIVIKVRAAEAFRVSKRGAHVGKRHTLIAPLIGMLIEIACCIHLA